MQLTRIHIIIFVSTASLIVIMLGIYLWHPWRQDVSVTLPSLTSDPVNPSRVETPYGNVQTDFTRIINPADIETRITKDEFSKVQMGMSYKDIADIVGGTGMLLNQTNAWWQVFATYIYYGDDRWANANFTFQDDRLIARKSFGLK